MLQGNKWKTLVTKLFDGNKVPQHYCGSVLKASRLSTFHFYMVQMIKMLLPGLNLLFRAKGEVNTMWFTQIELYRAI